MSDFDEEGGDDNADDCSRRVTARGADSFSFPAYRSSSSSFVGVVALAYSSNRCDSFRLSLGRERSCPMAVAEEVAVVGNRGEASLEPGRGVISKCGEGAFISSGVRGLASPEPGREGTSKGEEEVFIAL